MTVSAEDCIAALLAEYAPASVLVIGDAAPETAAEVTRVAATEAPRKLEAVGRFDFAIVSGLLEEIEAADAEAVLGRLKNLHTSRFLLLADPARASLGHDALLALALAPFEHLADGRVAWRYDLDRYNPERRWNNPEDWANPHNFDRFRW
ncbi:DUF6231 family protein [Thioalkalivibrio sp. XN8]|uniref:DUF6231 family protein n=1 Tax=Thioalkalivibrio sp. XN8 TaxID=2712863 RepID=UPI0013EDB19D|nr:hypothetical protein [Thioalkalivibrio sp. XN8]